MQLKNSNYILGLDIGMASVGAALISYEAENICDLYVRTFDKAEAPKTGESLNKKRRDARSVRRRIRRRAFRLLRLARFMLRIGIIEEAAPESFWLTNVSLWDLRAEGLDRRLNGKEWASVIYHIVKHRGFQSNRKSEAKEDDKAGQMLSGAANNQARIRDKGWRTAGEMIAKDPLYREAKRNKRGDYSHTLLRADLLEELTVLFERQRSFGSPHADLEFETSVQNLLMARRPTHSGDSIRQMVGKCTLEKEEYRGPKAGYRSQRFIWLGKLNNLRIRGPQGERNLTDDERWQIINLPFFTSKLTFKQVRKKLDIDQSESFNLCSYGRSRKNKGSENEKDPETSTFFEAKEYHLLRKAYAEAGLLAEWERDSADPDRLDTIGEALTCYKEDDDIRTWLSERGVEAPIIEAILGVSFTQFIRLSQKAIEKLLPLMELGHRYDEAATLAGYNHSQPDEGSAKHRYLPPPDKTSITNPVVRRALNQARKLVNAIIRKHGPPISVHIELARDLSKPFSERRDISSSQKAFQEEKATIREQFINHHGNEPRKDDLLKYRLFREQLGQCPYCQSALSIERLCEPGYAQVDHILPFSRSFDDSMNNKVAVHTRCNQDKGNRTPFEFFGGKDASPEWQRFVAWTHGAKNIRKAKRDRMLRINFGKEEASGFRDRNLNDTRYICREFKRMLETYLQWRPESDAKERCVVVSGRLTAFLRTRWGLLKEREHGDLHHALDAAVVAAASRSLVKRLADHSRRREVEMLRDCVDMETGEILDDDMLQLAEERFPEPWPHFRKELLGRLSPDPAAALEGISRYSQGEYPPPMRVSRPPKRRGSGEAHKETIRSLRGNQQSVIKTPLENLKLKDLERIVGGDRDKKLVEAIRNRLEQYGGDGKKAFGKGKEPLRKPSHDPEKAPVIRSVKLANDSQNSGIPVRGGIADNGDMLRVDIFRKKKKFYGVPIYAHQATRKELPNRAAVGGKLEIDWEVMDESSEFLFSLYPNDWVRLTLKKEVREGYFGSLNRSTAAINIWTHDRNRRIGKDGLIEGNGIKNAIAIEKFHVDIMGRLYPARNEHRRPLFARGQRA